MGGEQDTSCANFQDPGITYYDLTRHKVSCCVDLTLPHSLPHCLSHSLPHSLTPLLIQSVTSGPCHVPCKVTPSVTQRGPHMWHLPLQSLYIPVLFPL